jgi:hypothetical protein
MSATHSSMPTHTQPLRAATHDPTTLRLGLSITEAINTSPFITTHDGVRQLVDFVQTIFTPDLLVVGLRKDADFVFAKPLHATPEYVFGERPIYVLEDLEILDEGHVQHTMIDREVAELHNITVCTEVIRYRMLTADLVYLEGRLMELEKQWGEMSSKKLGCIHCLEMANVLAHLVIQRGDILDVCYNTTDHIARLELVC